MGMFVALQPDQGRADTLTEFDPQSSPSVQDSLAFVAPIEHTGNEWAAHMAGEMPALGPDSTVGAQPGWLEPIYDLGGRPGAVDANPYTGNVVRGPNPDGGVTLQHELRGNVVRVPAMNVRADSHPGPVGATDYGAQLGTLFNQYAPVVGPDNYADLLANV